jgi:hypothetical protein
MNKKYICHSDDSGFNKEMKDLLLYRKIVKAEAIDEQTATLTLDNGVEITTKGNEGCGGCGNGWFYLNKLNACDNVITNVECVCEGSDYDDCVYKIFVFTTDDKIECVSYEGYDNGYYGTGFEVYVKVGDNE